MANEIPVQGNNFNTWGTDLNNYLRKGQGWIDVRAYGAKGDGSTDDTEAIQDAIDAAEAANGTVFLPAGTYLVSGDTDSVSAALNIRGNSTGFIGAGSAVTTIKLHDTQANDAPIVLEVGDTASGNIATAYTNIIVGGITFDGNKGTVSKKASDIYGWGMITTKISYSYFYDIAAVDCHQGGFGTVIDSNYNTGVGFYIEDCGNSVQGTAGWEMNSSKYSSYTGITTKDCYLGLKVLDNCWNNYFQGSAYNATSQGLVYQNQSVNESYSNIFDISVFDGCTDNGASISVNCRNSTLNLNIQDVTGRGFHVVGNATAANVPSGNIINLTTRNCGKMGLLLDGNYNFINHTSITDGLTGVQGASYAVDIGANYAATGNKLNVIVQDSSTWQVRGISVRAGAIDNEILSYYYLNTADPYTDIGIRTKFNHGSGIGSDIASSATIEIPLFGSMFTVTGTADITTITSGNKNKGRTISLLFSGTKATNGLVDGNNLKIAGTLAYTPDDTINLISNGTNWYETSRSVN